MTDNAIVFVQTCTCQVITSGHRVTNDGCPLHGQQRPVMVTTFPPDPGAPWGRCSCGAALPNPTATAHTCIPKLVQP